MKHDLPFPRTVCTLPLKTTCMVCQVVLLPPFLSGFRLKCLWLLESSLTRTTDLKSYNEYAESTT